MTCFVTPLKFSTQTVFEVMFDFVAACLAGFFSFSNYGRGLLIIVRIEYSYIISWVLFFSCFDYCKPAFVARQRDNLVHTGHDVNKNYHVATQNLVGLKPCKTNKLNSNCAKSANVSF